MNAIPKQQELLAPNEETRNMDYALIPGCYVVSDLEATCELIALRV